MIISGHRRVHACKFLGIELISAIIRRVNDYEAICMMVDSNFQREEILPSEKARAYKMKLNAVKRQGVRNDLTSAHDGQKLNRKSSRDLIVENAPDSSTQIQRFVRLTELIPELLKMVDEGKLALTPAVEISYLPDNEQVLIAITIESEQSSPSLSQAQRMRKMSMKGELNEDTVLSIMSEKKKPDRWNFTIPVNKLSPYFPKYFSTEDMETVKFSLLERWTNIISTKTGVFEDE